MSNANQKMLMIGSLAAALRTEHHVYQLPGNSIGVGRPKQLKQLSVADHEAIEKAKQKRARRRAKRLKDLK